MNCPRCGSQLKSFEFTWGDETHTTYFCDCGIGIDSTGIYQANAVKDTTTELEDLQNSFKNLMQKFQENQNWAQRASHQLKHQTIDLTLKTKALKDLLSTVKHERKTGLCQSSEWIQVINNADIALFGKIQHEK